MSFWKKTMDYLGLGPDDAYDDYDDQVEPEPQAIVRRRVRRATTAERRAGRASRRSSVAGRARAPARVISAVPDAAELPVA